jgi:glycosyl transferase family 25
MVRVSILIPLYNGIEFLEECIDSVISQTFTDWEALIGINGHGEDGGEVGLIAKTIASRDHRIKVIIQGPPLSGKVQSLNNLVSFTGADLICVLDCDDKWKSNKLQRQIEVLETVACNVAAIGTFCTYFGEINMDLTVLEPGYITLSSLVDTNPIINSSSMIKKEYCLWEDKDYTFGVEDYYLWMQICLKGGKLYNIPEYLTWHRIHKTSAFNSNIKQEINVGIIRRQYRELYKNTIDYIDAILYINLEYRTDRNEHILSEISKICNDSSKIHRIDAIRKDPGALGCGLSHIKALEYALEHPKWKNILILEDDFTFKTNDSNLIISDITHIIKSVTAFDIILLSFGNYDLKYVDTHVDNIKKMIYSQTTSSYIIKNEYIPKLLNVFKDAMVQMELHGRKFENCIDIAWTKLQPSDNWYSIFPAIGYQYSSYSDIENMYISYNC